MGEKVRIIYPDSLWRFNIKRSLTVNTVDILKGSELLGKIDGRLRFSDIEFSEGITNTPNYGLDAEEMILFADNKVIVFETFDPEEVVVIRNTK